MLNERHQKLFDKLVGGENQVSLMRGTLKGEEAVFLCVVRDIVGTRHLKSFHPVAVMLEPEDLTECVAFNGQPLGSPDDVLNN